MRNCKLLLLLALTSFMVGSCVTSYPVYEGGNPHGLPPGQAKKIYGTKSAKPFAPGQQKKYNY
ncbi:MAG TPA: hypothetical protein VM802_06785 [Chitinophaga sp.]|uniref:hypothetical protein n=1 Tax=Chitinophaga sp. TaxID=1869181 RepID=UPI002CBBF90D|nr:hypothetical protein [Chitinophaga sp.]HVI44555.1 hypothetical protein [Chitinophaga sp.]